MLAFFFVSFCKAWFDEEQAFFDSFASRPRQTISQIKTTFKGDLALNQRAYLDKGLDWSDPNYPRTFYGLDLVPRHPDFLSKQSITRNYEDTVFNLNINHAYINIASPVMISDFAVCFKAQVCKISSFTASSYEWSLTSPSTKRKETWKRYLRELIPEQFFAKKASPVLSRNVSSSGVWGLFYRPTYLVLNFTIHEIEGSSNEMTYGNHCVIFPLFTVTSPLGIIQARNLCDAPVRNNFHSSMMQDKATEAILSFCKQSAQPILHHT
ncbi:hypothetical protein DSO57_1015208 [Entomophthora muscae]|uniref:Uncharacterized protein n=1 Tax=Entomophthora muscae TaxID=34485 RepID=A0ACC2RWF5_9FUNG|nr:hypothetical protein DSO57_1015208 [Entomophthora muscae]